jgi:hypothetical protein
MVLGVLSPDGNYFEMRVISETFRWKRISIDNGKLHVVGEISFWKVATVNLAGN